MLEQPMDVKQINDYPDSITGEQFSCQALAEIVGNIQVIGHEDEDVTVVNESQLEMIGKGRQGAVFKINDHVCMKVYGQIDDCNREYEAMMLGQKTDLIPTVYCKGENFLTMEMVYGIDLREYLQSQPLTKELSFKLLQLLQTFKEIGYERIDHHKRQIFLQEDGSLKVIDVGRTIWRNRTYPYPRKLINSLGEAYRETFLEHAKELAPELYEDWLHYMEREAEARRLTTEVLSNEIDLNDLNVGGMLTTEDDEEYHQQLEQLFRKVVKEETVRQLEKALAREGIGEEVIRTIQKLEELKLEIKDNSNHDKKEEKKKNKKKENKRDKMTNKSGKKVRTVRRKRK